MPAPGATPAPPPPPAPVAAPPPTEPGVRELADGRAQILSASAYKRIKENARKRGRDEAMTELDKLAQAAGFKSAADALANINANRGSGHGGGGNRGQPGRQASADEPPVPPSPPQNRNDRRAWERYERARQQFERDRTAYRERISREAQKRRELQRQLDAKDAEMALRETAVSCGVRDVDYAIRLLTRHLDGQTEEQLQNFDERKFFEGLRNEKPYLFGEITTPVTTGTAGAAPTGGGAPPPARPGQTAAGAAAAAQVDARKMTREQFAERLAKMGLNPPSV